MLPKNLNRTELRLLSEYIDQLDATIGLSNNTVNDVRFKMLEAYSKLD